MNSSTMLAALCAPAGAARSCWPRAAARIAVATSASASTTTLPRSAALEGSTCEVSRRGVWGGGLKLYSLQLQLL